MHVDVIELLRCPVGHAESPLVATALRQRDRRILQGTLGCPACGAEYSIEAGVADFRRAAALETSPDDAAAPPRESTIVRLAAQLDLRHPGGTVVLCGAYAAYAPTMSVMFESAFVALNPRSPAAIATHASAILCDLVVPLVDGRARAVALDEHHATTIGLMELVRLVHVRGRVVAPAATVLPPDLAELARDHIECVAERVAAASPFVGLQRPAR